MMRPWLLLRAPLKKDACSTRQKHHACALRQDKNAHVVAFLVNTESRHVQELDNREMYLTQLIKSFNPKKLTKPGKLDSGPPLDAASAAALLQRSERGRQAREALNARLVTKKQRQLADRRNRAGVALTQEMAAVKIQSMLRGMIWRRRIRREADEARLRILCL
jgi:hypothetical protein